MPEESKLKSVKNKVEQQSDRIRPDVVAIVAVVLIILVYIGVEVHKVTHIDVKTITATQSVVYETIEAKALVVRDEQPISTNSGGVTVPCIQDGEKVALDGNIAMTFNSSEDAKKYSDLQVLHSQLDYYLDLQTKSAGLNSDIATIDKDIIEDINAYVLSSSKGDISALSTDAEMINDKLTRRQLIIGQQIDFGAIITDLQSQINALSSVKPTSFITTDKSGTFSSYVDGCEEMFDYDSVTELTPEQLENYLTQAENAEKNDAYIGKLINNFKWYFCCTVDASALENLHNGDSLDVAIKGTDRVLRCKIESGADVSLGTEKSVLVLSSSEMDGMITSIRSEDIEIRYNEYKGFKIPAEAIHVNADGKKCVYALIANTVAERTGEVLYTTKDYVIFKYDAKNSDSIRMYDQIITKGKDLYDGKIYS